MKKFTTLISLIVCFLLFASSIYAQTTVTIGTGTSTLRPPLGIYFGYERNAAIYTSTEIGSAGDIQTLAWQVNAAAAGAVPLKVYLTETTASTLTAGTWATITTGATLVFDGTVTPTTGGWFEITLSSSFAYSGSDNLLVLVETNFGGTGNGTSTSTAVRYSTATGQNEIWTADNNPPTGNGTVNANRPNLQIDILTGPPPTCPKPTVLTIANIGETSADLGWTANGTESTWNIEYGPAGFTPGTGTVESVSSNPYTLSGLTATTAYAFYVQADCGGGDVSTWAGPKTFNTACATISTLPYNEDFEATSANLPCWTVINNNADADQWVIQTSATYALSGTQSYQMYTDYNSGANDDYLVSPKISLTGNQRFIFNHRVRSSSEPNDFEVLLSTTGTNPTDFTEVLLPNTSYNNITFSETIINLSAYSGDVYIAFHVKPAGLDGYYLYVDNVTVEDIPSCSKPTLLTVANITETTADLGWTNGATETAWNIEYGPVGFTPGTGTIESVSSNPYTLSGLTATTAYAFYVQADCGGGDVSAWTGPKTFNTACATISTLPYNEDFEATSATLPCWTVINNNSDGDKWVIQTSASYALSGTQSYQMYTDFNAGANDDYLVSPKLSLTGNQRFVFNHRVRSSGEPNDFEVLLSTTGTNPTDFTEVLLPNTSYSNTTFSETIINLSAYSGDVYIAFHVKPAGLDGYYLYVDNVTVEDLPSCSKPTLLTVANITETTADLGWTNGATETAWNIEYGPVGFTQGTGTIESVSSNPYTLSGLTASSNYEYYVQADCGGGDVSIWAGPKAFTTACAYSTDFSENFDALTTPNLPTCWGKLTPAAFSFATVTTITAQNFSSPNGVQLYNSGAGASEHVLLISPILSNLNDGTHQLRFHAKGNGSNVSVIIGTMSDPTNAATFTAFQTVSGLSTTTFNEYTVYFTTYSGTDNYIALKHPGTATYGYIYLDNINWETVPTCLAPNSLTTANIGEASVDLGWTANGTETTWNIEYGPVGFTQGTGTIESVSSNPYTLSGLNASTAYAFYVQADCGGGDVSTWTGPLSFTTACATYAAPFTETFENAGLIPNCWAQGASNAENWKFSNTGAGNHIGNNGTITGTTTSNGYFAWVDDSSPHSTGTTLLSPFIDVTSLTVPMLSFYLLSNNETYTNVTLNIDIWDGSTWNNGFYTHNSNSLNGAWEQLSISLGSLSFSGPMQIRFVVNESNGTDFYDDIAIDDVSIIEAPTCPAPVLLTASNLTETSADLGWNNGGSETSWNIEYGPAGFTQGTGTIEAVSSNPYTLSGLNASTAYAFYVQADCGGGDVSTWVGPYVFNTACGAITEFSQNFDAVTTPNLPYCWNKSIPGTLASAAVVSYATGPYSSPNCVRIYNSTGTATDNVLLISPNLSNLSDGTHQIRFYAKGSSTNLSVIVGTITDPTDGSTFTEFQTVSGLNTATFTECTVSFASYSGSDTYIAFKHPGTVINNAIYIDNVNWEVIPTCPKPTTLSASNATETTVDVAWVNGGSESSWNIEYGIAGFVQGTGTIVTVSTNPYTLDNLSASSIYDFYVQADCGGGDVSQWAGPFSFSTACGIANVPYVQNFETAVVPAIPNCNTIENAGTGNNWITANNPGSGFTTKVLKYAYHSTNPANAWFYTPGINLIGGTTYDLIFKYGNNSDTYIEKLKVAYGDVATSASMTNLIVDYPNIDQNALQNSSTEFTPASDGVYYIGFNVYSDIDQFNLYVDDILIDVATKTNIKPIINNNIIIYPNPTNGAINIDLGNQTSAKIYVINSIGKTIITKENAKNTATLDLSNLAKGIYFVKIVSGNTTLTKKIHVID